MPEDGKDGYRSGGYVNRRNFRDIFLYAVFVAAVVVLLYLLQYMAAMDIISERSAYSYLYLDYESPNVFSFFLSNYIHEPQNPVHLRENVFSFILISFLIGFLYFFLFPRSDIKMPDYFLFSFIFVAFLVVPFSVSAISYIFWETGAFDPAIRYSAGFSGIAWALMGFLFFLAAVYCLRAVSGRCEERMEDFSGMISVYFPFIFILSFLIVFPVFFIIADINTKNNLYAHLAGFAYGWLIPPLLGSFLLPEESRTLRRFNFFLMVSAFVMPFILSLILLFTR